MTKQQRWKARNPDKVRAHRAAYIERHPERVKEIRRRYERNRRDGIMPRPRKTQQQSQPPQNPTQEVPPYIQEMRRQAGYDETKAREMAEQAAALNEWVRSPQVRSTARIKAMPF